MVDSARTIDIVSADDYLVRELASQTRSEFVNGAVYAMTGATDRHNRIAGNLSAALHSHLPDRCVPYMADMKVRIRLERAEFYYYPDGMVCCGPSNQSRDWRDDPIVVAEVLSTSTERIDRTEKFTAYTQIATLQEYLLIDQAIARVEIFRRSNQWQREVFVAGDALLLASIAFEMPIAALYRRVEF